MTNEARLFWLVKRVLLSYKKKIPLRVMVVLVVSLVIWACGSQDMRTAIAVPILVGGFEYMTLNVILDREFYPLDMFADDIFPDRESFGYKALYIGFYIVFWGGIFYFLGTST
jgi:hypothetical protein